MMTSDPLDPTPAVILNDAVPPRSGRPRWRDRLRALAAVLLAAEVCGQYAWQALAGA